MKKVLYIVSLLLAMACQHIERPEKPKNLIPEATMVDMLAEIYLGNAARTIDNKTMRTNGIKIDSFLFKKYRVDSLQFAQSNAFYASDLNTYNSIFQKIEQKLEILKKDENSRKLLLDSLKKKKLKRQDSMQPKGKELLEELEEVLDTVKREGILIPAASS